MISDQVVNFENFNFCWVQFLALCFTGLYVLHQEALCWRLSRLNNMSLKRSHIYIKITVTIWKRFLESRNDSLTERIGSLRYRMDAVIIQTISVLLRQDVKFGVMHRDLFKFGHRCSLVHYLWVYFAVSLYNKWKEVNKSWSASLKVELYQSFNLELSQTMMISPYW